MLKGGDRQDGRRNEQAGGEKGDRKRQTDGGGGEETDRKKECQLSKRSQGAY